MGKVEGIFMPSHARELESLVVLEKKQNRTVNSENRVLQFLFLLRLLHLEEGTFGVY